VEWKNEGVKFKWNEKKEKLVWLITCGDGEDKKPTSSSSSVAILSYYSTSLAATVLQKPFCLGTCDAVLLVATKIEKLIKCPFIYLLRGPQKLKNAPLETYEMVNTLDLDIRM